MRAASLSFLVVFALVACTSLPPDEGQTGFDESDRELEREIALQGVQYVRQELVPHSDPYVQAYVQRIGQRVLAVTDRPELTWHFQVIDSDEMNAFTIGDGRVYVYSGLLIRLENEAQVASVIAHEAAHVTRWHTVVSARKAQESQMLAGLASVALGGGELASLAAGVAGSIMENGFSREQEDQADRVGLAFTHQAGYDVREFPRVFEIFGEVGGEPPQIFNDLFGSHSTPGERVAATRALVNERYAGSMRNPRIGKAEHEAIVRRLQQP